MSSEQWRAEPHWEFPHGVEVYCDTRPVALVYEPQDAARIVSDHNELTGLRADYLQAIAQADDWHRMYAEERERRVALEELIERTAFALSLGGNGTLREAERVQRDYGNALANLYLDLCAAMGRGHRAALSSSSAVPDGGGEDR